MTVAMECSVVEFAARQASRPRNLATLPWNSRRQFLPWFRSQLIASAFRLPPATFLTRVMLMDSPSTTAGIRPISYCLGLVVNKSTYPVHTLLTSFKNAFPLTSRMRSCAVRRVLGRPIHLKLAHLPRRQEPIIGSIRGKIRLTGCIAQSEQHSAFASK